MTESTMENEELFGKIRGWFESDKKIPVTMRDKFFCMALLALNTGQVKANDKLNKIYPLYQFFALIGGVLLPVASALITAWFLGKFHIEIVRVP